MEQLCKNLETENGDVILAFTVNEECWIVIIITNNLYENQSYSCRDNILSIIQATGHTDMNKSSIEMQLKMLMKQPEFNKATKNNSVYANTIKN